jgi:predicted GNAT family acetyltransferase
MDEDLKVEREEGVFFIAQGGKRIAEMTWSRGHDKKLVIIEHTEVDPSLRGRGIPKLLVKAAVEWARQEKIRIVPLCPFAKHVFDRTPEYADVRAR